MTRSANWFIAEILGGFLLLAQGAVIGNAFEAVGGLALIFIGLVYLTRKLRSGDDS